MSNNKIVHYNLDELDSKNAIFNMLYGERSNGKSYQVKHKKAVTKFLKSMEIDSNNPKRFILMRRWKEEITSEKIEAYFQDVDIYKLTKEKYNCITMYKKQLYLANYINETGKTIKGKKIGYVVALSTEQNYAGGSYLDVEDIIFEEFMSRGSYIANEPDKLMNFYCTVDRKRGKVRLWLVGNTISRVCPYINEWGLHEIVSKQKQGTIVETFIDTGDFDLDNKPIKVKLAIEYCKSTGRSSFTIGKHKDMLNTGSWQSDPQPHLPKSKKCYKILYRIMFQYKSFKFVGEYLQDKEDLKNKCWFIFPYDGEIKNKILVFSDEVRISKFYQGNIYDLTIKNDKLKNLFITTFRQSNIFYSTDLCGTDFKQVINFEIRR